jgi:WD40 repeat protein
MGKGPGRDSIVVYGRKKDSHQNGSHGRYVPTGHIVYRLESTVFAVTFDSKRLVASGTPVAIVEGIWHAGGTNTAASQYAFSTTGSMAYIPEPSTQRRIGIFDSEGRIDSMGFRVEPIHVPRLSPDGGLLAGGEFGRDVSVYDLTGNMAPIRIDAGGLPLLWAPEGKRIVFDSGIGANRGFHVQNWPIHSPPEFFKPYVVGAPDSWSPDGRSLFFVNDDGSVWSFTLTDKQSKLLFSTAPRANGNRSAAISPDGQWIAYYSLEAGNVEVFVQPYPPTGAKYQVSRGGGHHPLWSPDGKRLYYVRNTDQLIAVDVNTASATTFGQPNVLKVPVDQQLNNLRNYDITQDGKRFAVSLPASQESARQVHVVLNWFSELQQRVPSP